jgi:hypothetical protein
MGPPPAALASHVTMSITGSTPVSPSNDETPSIQGTTTAPAGTAVGILTSSVCTSGLVGNATVVAGSPNTFSVPVTLTNNSSTPLYAGVYVGGHIACSAGFTYQEDSALPTVALPSGATSPGEGTTATYTFSASDANQTGKSGIAATGTSGNCGSGIKVAGSDTFPGTDGSNSDSGSFQCTFPDGPAATSVSVTVTDRAGNSRISSVLNVSVSNVAPTVGMTAGPTAGSTAHTYSYSYSITDPGIDTVSSVQTSCGTGGTKSNESNTSTSGSFSCTWASAGARSVTAQATDSDGAAGNTASLPVVIAANQAPVVTLSSSNDTTVDEGGSATFDYSISDTELDGIASVATSCGPGGVKVSGSDTFDDDSGSFACLFPDGPDNSTVSAAATDVLSAVGVADTQDITVANVAPTVTFTAAPLNVVAHHPASYAYAVTDPGGDTIASVDTSCGLGVKLGDIFSLGIGSFTCTWTTPTSGGLMALSASSASESGDSDVTVTATDADGASDTETQSVEVAPNEAPVVTLDSGNATEVDEGSTVHTFNYSISDAEGDSISSVETSCGSAGNKVSDSDTFDNDSGSFDCTFPDGPDGSTVSAAATDEFGEAGSPDTADVTVKNVTPSVSLSGIDSVDEGTTQTYTYTVDDSGDDSLTITESCGPNASLIDTPLAPNSFDCSFPDGPKNSLVSVTADDGSGSGSDTITVSISDLPMNVVLTGTTLVDEGTTTTYNYTLTDPGDDPVTSVTEDCGTGATTIDTPLASNSFDCVFPDGPATPTVSVIATGKDGSGQDSIDVAVANVAPSVTLSGPSEVDESASGNYSFTVTDPGTDTVTAKTGFPSCGTLGTALVTGATTFSCTFSSVTADSVTSVAIEVEDDSGAGASAAKDVTVKNRPPSGGSSSGGGGTGGSADPTPAPSPAPSPSSSDVSEVVSPAPSPTPSPSESVDGEAPKLEELEAGPATFSPNHDGRKDLFEVEAAFSEPVSWSFAVSALPSGSPLRFEAPVAGFSNQGAGDVVKTTWDGSMGDLNVPDGVYSWSLTARDQAGTAAAPITGSVVVDNTAPSFRRLSALPRAFRRGRGVRIRLAANEVVRAKVAVRSRGRVIRKFDQLTMPALKTVKLRWDGRNRDGRRVARRHYRLIVRLIDEAGNRSVKRLGLRVKR